MKELYLKERKLGGRISHAKRGIVRPLLFALAAVAVVAFAVMVAPHILQWPVTITINGETTQVNYGTTVRRAALGHLDRGYLYGDMLAVDGSVFQQFGGEEPTFFIGGEEVAADTTLRSRRDITVSRGSDITESTSEEVVEELPELVFRGSGPFRRVVSSGQVGTSLRTYGTLSGIEVSVEEITELEPTEVRASSLRGNRPRIVALTFDDGPHPEHTVALLDLLAAEGVQATFFVVGTEVARHPSIARRIVEDGHQIANHSYNHPDYRDLSYQEIRTDIERSQDIIEDATGVRPDWIRPPYGLTDASVYSVIGDKDLMIAHWTVDPTDWRIPGPRVIRNRVVANSYPGAVILLHDGGGNRTQTVRATRGIIRELRAADYEFVTVERLYNRANR